jgi:NAD(P)-dependent dehydrogenase (short-subunit alcohol dehydrogenase family)
MAQGQFGGLAAVVTGGGSGIGRAVAAALSAAGARVAVLDLAPGDPLGPDCLALTCDVCDDESVRAAIEAAAGALGRLDIVINNAGIGAQGTVEDNSDDEWRRVLDVNVLGAVRVSRAALPHLRRSPAAAIVNTCSIAATTGLPERAAYSASKGAILALTRAMAADHLREGIRVNCVNPGTADTPWVQRLLASAPDPAAELAALNARQPHGRLVSADEVAAAVLYLASPAAGSTAGTMLEVDGGMHSLRLRPASAADATDTAR